MQFFAVGQRAEGFIALGQEATGVIAIGQMATGVVAIGQLARGVFTVGMLSFGVVSVGMLSVGLVYSVAMLGAGGRCGPGMLILPLVPVPRGPFELPARTQLEAIRRGVTGWIDVLLQTGPRGLPQVVHDGMPIDAALPARLLRAATIQVSIGKGSARALAEVAPVPGGGLRIERLMMIPPDRAGCMIAALQLLGLTIAAYAYWQFVLVDLLDFAYRLVRAVVTGA